MELLVKVLLFVGIPLGLIALFRKPLWDKITGRAAKGIDDLKDSLSGEFTLEKAEKGLEWINGYLASQEEERQSAAEFVEKLNGISLDKVGPVSPPATPTK